MYNAIDTPCLDVQFQFLDVLVKYLDYASANGAATADAGFSRAGLVWLDSVRFIQSGSFKLINEFIINANHSHLQVKFDAFHFAYDAALFEPCKRGERLIFAIESRSIDLIRYFA